MRRDRLSMPIPQGKPPLPLAVASGAALGALFGAALGGIERALLLAVGVQPGLGGTLVWAASGAVVGALSAITRLYGAGWALACSVALIGSIGSAFLGGVLAEAGIPAALGVIFVAGLSFGVAQTAGHSGLPPEVKLGLACFFSLAASTIGPLQLHLIAGLTTGGSIGLSLLLLLVIASISVPVGATGQELRAPLPALGLALLLSGLGNALLSRRAPEPIPAAGAVDRGPVVIIVIDGLRADRFAPLGYRRRTTPNLDALAERAILYESAHATSNWTAPSLGSILTGRSPHGHGAGLNGGQRGANTPLSPEVQTLAADLRRARVPSVAAVADPKLRNFSLDMGFSIWRDDPGRGAVPLAWLPAQVSGLDPLLGGLGWPRRAPAGRVVDEAAQLVRALPDRGWMMLVHLADAGGPFRFTRDDLRAVGLTTRPYPSDQLDAALHHVDRELGRLLEILPQDAWIFVMGSRGVSLGEKRTGWGRFEGRRFGHLMFEEIVRVPLLVAGPRISPRRVSAPVSLVDVAPTIRRLFGIPDARYSDGMALAELSGETRIDRPVIAQSSLYGPEQQMVILGNHKLIRTDGRSVVYDLAGDPAETTALRAGGTENDLRQRNLASMLVPGVAPLRTPPLRWQVGQLISRFGSR